MNSAVKCILKAGAGAQEILFPAAMFPVEGFNGNIHLNPYVRVLLLEQTIRVAIVCYETVNVPSDVISAVKDLVSKVTDTPRSRVWVHATHAITTPHAPDNAAKRALFVETMITAADAAARQAAAKFQPARMGIGTGTCHANANRDIKIGDAWYYGLGSTMPSNKKMTVIAVQSLTGEPIGYFVSYGIKPTAIDNVEMDTVTRWISSDVPGVACRMMEEVFHAPAMFCMSAAGDQIPRETAMYWEADETGQAVEVKQTVAEGIEIVERLGNEMGRAAIEIANNITFSNDGPGIIVAADTAFSWPNKSGDGDVTTGVRGITIGDDIALIGLKPEVNAITEMELTESSPYPHTVLLSFLDGDSKYMPDDDSHDLQTWEWKRAGTAKGSAEQFVATAVKLLNAIRSGEVVTCEETRTEADDSATVEKDILSLGGLDWIVLDKRDNKALVVSAKVLEQRAYHAPGGAVTWEESEIRAYLNGDFLDKTFSNEEKDRIIETFIENKSNPQYGVVGGNPTTDKVFLLSLSEAEKYMGSGVELLRGINIQTDEVNWWHLRSPGEAPHVASSVNTIGLIDYHGVFDGVIDPTGGVRPALWLSLD